MLYLLTSNKMHIHNILVITELWHLTITNKKRFRSTIMLILLLSGHVNKLKKNQKTRVGAQIKTHEHVFVQKLMYWILNNLIWLSNSC